MTDEYQMRQFFKKPLKNIAELMKNAFNEVDAKNAGKPIIMFSSEAVKTDPYKDLIGLA